MLDQTVAGGLTHGLSPLTCVVKECGEEASIPEELVLAPGRLRATGAITYVATAEGGWIQPGEFEVFTLWSDGAVEKRGIEAWTDLPSTRRLFHLSLFLVVRDP